MRYIYVIRNTKNGKVYIGQTRYKELRFEQHIKSLKLNKHFNYKLQEDFNTFGEDAFTYRILEVVQDKESYKREDYWINSYGGIDNVMVYNMQTSHIKNSDYRQRKSIAYTGNHPNHFKGMTHKEIYGEQKAEQMRKINSDKHKNKKPSYIPYKGKIKCVDETLLTVTPEVITTVKNLRNNGYKYKQITKITGIKTNGIYNIIYDKLKL